MKHQTNPDRLSFGPLLHDPLTMDGAAELAERIKRVWQAHGYEIDTRIEREERRAGVYFYCVRSNLKNGMPARGERQ